MSSNSSQSDLNSVKYTKKNNFQFELPPPNPILPKSHADNDEENIKLVLLQNDFQNQTKQDQFLMEDILTQSPKNFNNSKYNEQLFEQIVGDQKEDNEYGEDNTLIKYIKSTYLNEDQHVYQRFDNSQVQIIPNLNIRLLSGIYCNLYTLIQKFSPVQNFGDFRFDYEKQNALTLLKEKLKIEQKIINKKQKSLEKIKEQIIDNKNYNNNEKNKEQNEQNYVKNQNKDSDIESTTKDSSLNKKFSHTLEFESDFESGNLISAYQYSENVYDLVLQNDINSKGQTQWFYFKVKNTLKGQTVKFNIINLIKNDSLFNQGMQPAIFSEKQNQLTGTEWYRDGFNISYYKNSIQRETVYQNYSTLSFTFNFSHSQDVVSFAHCIPYTYTKLINYLNIVEKSPVITRETLCKSICKYNCDLLTITKEINKEQFDQQQLQKQEDIKLLQEQKQQKNLNQIQKKNSNNNKNRSKDQNELQNQNIKEKEEKNKKFIVIILARQHPGETPGSFVAEGVINFLTQIQRPDVNFLLENIIFKVIPMVNPDGVIHGSYRCNLAGFDLNRQWAHPNKELHPTIYAIKQMVNKIINEDNIPVKLILDLHAHSRKTNAFFLGNPQNMEAQKNNQPREFPLICCQQNKQISLKNCEFKFLPDKDSTLRQAFYNDFDLNQIFTFETSFFGYSRFLNDKSHFTEKDYKDLGKSLCVGIGKFFYKEQYTPLFQKQEKMEFAIRQQQQQLINSQSSKQIGFQNTQDEFYQQKNGNSQYKRRHTATGNKLIIKQTNITGNNNDSGNKHKRASSFFDKSKSKKQIKSQHKNSVNLMSSSDYNQQQNLNKAQNLVNNAQKQIEKHKQRTLSMNSNQKFGVLAKVEIGQGKNSINSQLLTINGTSSINGEQESYLNLNSQLNNRPSKENNNLFQQINQLNNMSQSKQFQKKIQQNSKLVQQQIINKQLENQKNLKFQYFRQNKDKIGTQYQIFKLNKTQQTYNNIQNDYNNNNSSFNTINYKKSNSNNSNGNINVYTSMQNQTFQQQKNNEYNNQHVDNIYQDQKLQQQQVKNVQEIKFNNENQNKKQCVNQNNQQSYQQQINYQYQIQGQNNQQISDLLNQNNMPVLNQRNSLTADSYSRQQKVKNQNIQNQGLINPKQIIQNLNHNQQEIQERKNEYEIPEKNKTLNRKNSYKYELSKNIIKNTFQQQQLQQQKFNTINQRQIKQVVQTQDKKKEQNQQQNFFNDSQIQKKQQCQKKNKKKLQENIKTQESCLQDQLQLAKQQQQQILNDLSIRNYYFKQEKEKEKDKNISKIISQDSLINNFL